VHAELHGAQIGNTFLKGGIWKAKKKTLMTKSVVMKNEREAFAKNIIIEIIFFPNPTRYSDVIPKRFRHLLGARCLALQLHSMYCCVAVAPVSAYNTRV